MATFAFGLFVQIPEWLTKELVVEILQSKVFLAIYYGGAAVLGVVAYIGKRKYSERNLKALLDRHLEKAKASEGKERASVKAVISHALRKARGLPAQGGTQFNPADVFQQAALLCAQRQPDHAIEVLKRETVLCEATVGYAQHQLRLAQERAATAHYEIGSIRRSQNKGADALDAFAAMLRANPGDHDALWWLGVQLRDLERFTESERYFNTLLHLVGNDQGMTADIKRELGAVFLGRKDYADAENVLAEAMQIEKDRHSQPGIALTQESIGAVKAGRRWWQKAREAYDESQRIFSALGDRESVERVQIAIDRMEGLRRRGSQARNGDDIGTTVH